MRRKETRTNRKGRIERANWRREVYQLIRKHNPHNEARAIANEHLRHERIDGTRAQWPWALDDE